MRTTPLFVNPEVSIEHMSSGRITMDAGDRATSQSDQFDPKWDFPEFLGEPKFLVLATTPRSGSHMLGHLLRETGLFGYPLEYFHPKNLAKWKKLAGSTSIRETLNYLIKRRTSPNGIFAIKLHYDHLDQLGGFQGLPKLFPEAQYIQLIRQGAVAQGVSRAIARATSQWIKTTQDGPNEQHEANQRKTPTVHFDWKLVDLCIKDNLIKEAAWRYALNVLAVPRIEIFMESLLANQSEVLADVADLMKVELAEFTVSKPLSTKSQRTQLNAEWVKLYLSKLPTQGIETSISVKPSMGYRARKTLSRLGIDLDPNR